jgi:hypothetical protein
MRSRAVVFAFDDDKRCLFGLKFACSRIRQFNRAIAVHVYIDGDTALLAPLAADDANLHVHSARSMKYVMPGILPPSFLKWHAVAELADRYDEIAYFDTDTFVFDDVDKLFSAADDAPFAARDFGVYWSDPPHKWGIVFAHSIPGYAEGIAQLSRLIGVQPVGHFNSGVMVFKDGFQRRVAYNIERLANLLRAFVRGLLPNPLRKGQLWFVEELCARFFVAMAGLREVRYIEPAVAPYYHEYATREVPGPGLIVHTWSAYFNVAVAEFGTPAEVAELMSIIAGARRNHRCFRWLELHDRLRTGLALDLRARIARRLLQL